MRQYGVAPVSVTPLLTRSGAIFEQAVTAVIAAHYETRDFAAEHGDSGAGRRTTRRYSPRRAPSRQEMSASSSSRA